MNKFSQKRLLSFLLALAMVFSLSATGLPALAIESGTKNEPVAAPLRETVVSQVQDEEQLTPLAAETYSFRLLFTSDLHGSFSDWRYSAGNSGGGLARIATAIEARRSGSNRLNASTLTQAESEARTMLIDVGDTIQGNGTGMFHGLEWDENVLNTGQMYPLLYGMELMKYDVWVMGNHEFNFGMDRLEKAYGKDLYGPGLHGFTGAILGGNVFVENEENYADLPVGSRVYDDFYVRQMPDGGPNVAIIGMTHSEITQWDAYNVLGAGLNTKTAAVATQETIAYLTSPEAEAIYGKIDVFVGAMHVHSGNGEDAGYGIINMNPELDLFLGAHGHSATNNTSTGVRFMELPGNASGSCLGQVDVTVTKQEDGSWKVADRIGDVAYTAVSPGSTSLESYIEEPAIAAAHQVAFDYSQQEVGTLSGGPLVDTEPVRGVTSSANIFYTYDNALNHLFFDAFTYASNEYLDRESIKEDAPAWMENAKVTLAASCALGSGSTNSLQTPGPITRANIGQIYNYDNNTLCIIELTGWQLKVLAEYGFSSGRTSNGTAQGLFISGVTSSSSYDRMLIGGDIYYTVDVTRSAWDRITDMRNADGTPFDMDAVYWLAANNHTTGSRFLASGSNYGAARLKALDDSKKLQGEDGLRYEADFANYGEYEAGMPIVRTWNAQEILTLDGADPINNGEGCTGMVADYILRKLGGNLTNEFSPNWRFDTSGTPSADWVLYNKAIEVVDANIGINYNGTGAAAATPANIRDKLASADVQDLWDLYSAQIETLLDGKGDVGDAQWDAFATAMAAAGEIITKSGTSAVPVAEEVAKAATAKVALEAAIDGLTTPIGPQEGEVRDITIFFTSDIHGAFANTNFATGANHAGMARIATVLKQQRAALTAAGKEWLTLDVGDTIQGAGTSGFINNPAYTYPVLKGFDYLGYDAEIMGNHEFNFGFDAMYQAYNGDGNNEDVPGLKADKLVGNVFKGNFTGDANVTGEDPLMEGFKAYEVYTVSGVRVAVIGMTNPGSDTWDAIKFQTAGYYTESAIGATKRAIQEIKAGDLADVIVLAAHMSTGDSFARPGSGASSVLADPYIAENVDVFLGGHGHSRQTRTINGVKYGENTNAGGSLGIVTIKATYEGGAWDVKNKAGAGVTINMLSISSSAQADADYLAYMAAEIAEADRYTHEKIGELTGANMVPASPLSSNMNIAYTEPTKLVDFIHEVQLYYANAQISIACPFSTSVQHLMGDITRGSLIGIYNYDSNTVYRIDMAGWQVDRIIEHVASNRYTAPNTTTDLSIRHSTSYRNDSLGGVKYTMDLTRPSGDRVTITEVRNLTTGEWEAFDPNARYIVAANDYRTSSSIFDESGGSNSFFTAAQLQAEDAPKLLQTDCNRDLPIAPDILSLMVHYISEVKGGIIDGTSYNKDWSIVPWWETTIENGADLRAEGERFVKSGKITNVSSSNSLKADSVRTLLTAERAIGATGLVVTANDASANFLWYGSAANPVVQIALKSDMTNSIFPVTRAITIAGTAGDLVGDSRLYSAAVAGLLPETEYIFRVSGDGLNFGMTYEFTTDAEPAPALAANVRTAEFSDVAGLVAFDISLVNLTRSNTVSIVFTLTGGLLDFNYLEALSGFDAMGSVRWTSLEDGAWKGELTLVHQGALLTSAAIDVVKLYFNAKGLGDATVTLDSVKVTAQPAEGGAFELVDAAVEDASATTSIVIVYSIYDINRDGKVSQLDLAIVALACGIDENDLRWNLAIAKDSAGEDITPAMCDFLGEGVVDIRHLIELLANYSV